MVLFFQHPVHASKYNRKVKELVSIGKLQKHFCNQGFRQESQMWFRLLAMSGQITAEKQTSPKNTVFYSHKQFKHQVINFITS